MLCISAAIAGMRCPSVTFVCCVKTNKNIFEIFSPLGSQAILVFLCQTVLLCDIPTGIPLTGASNAGAVGKQRDSERISLRTLHTGLQCCKPYESRSVKNKVSTDGGKRRAEHSRRRPSFVVLTR